MEEVLLFNLDSLSGHKIVTKPKKKLESRPETPVASPRNSMVQGPIVFRLLLGSRASVRTILFAADGPPMAEVGLKMGRENPVPTGSVYRLNRP